MMVRRWGGQAQPHRGVGETRKGTPHSMEEVAAAFGGVGGKGQGHRGEGGGTSRAALNLNFHVETQSGPK